MNRRKSKNEKTKPNVNYESSLPTTKKWPIKASIVQAHNRRSNQVWVQDPMTKKRGTGRNKAKLIK